MTCKGSLHHHLEGATLIEAVLIWIAVVAAVIGAGYIWLWYVAETAPMDTEIWLGGEPR